MDASLDSLDWQGTILNILTELGIPCGIQTLVSFVRARNKMLQGMTAGLQHMIRLTLEKLVHKRLVKTLGDSNWAIASYEIPPILDVVDTVSSTRPPRIGKINSVRGQSKLVADAADRIDILRSRPYGRPPLHSKSMGIRQQRGPYRKKLPDARRARERILNRQPAGLQDQFQSNERAAPQFSGSAAPVYPQPSPSGYVSCQHFQFTMDQVKQEPREGARQFLLGSANWTADTFLSPTPIKPECNDRFFGFPDTGAATNAQATEPREISSLLVSSSTGEVSGNAVDELWESCFPRDDGLANESKEHSLLTPNDGSYNGPVKPEQPKTVKTTLVTGRSTPSANDQNSLEDVFELDSLLDTSQNSPGCLGGSVETSSMDWLDDLRIETNLFVPETSLGPARMLNTAPSISTSALPMDSFRDFLGMFNGPPNAAQATYSQVTLRGGGRPKKTPTQKVSLKQKTVADMLRIQQEATRDFDSPMLTDRLTPNLEQPAAVENSDSEDATPFYRSCGLKIDMDLLSAPSSRSSTPMTTVRRSPLPPGFSNALIERVHASTSPTRVSGKHVVRFAQVVENRKASPQLPHPIISIPSPPESKSGSLKPIATSQVFPIKANRAIPKTRIERIPFTCSMTANSNGTSPTVVFTHPERRTRDKKLTRLLKRPKLKVYYHNDIWKVHPV